MTKKRVIEVQYIVSATIEIEQSVINQALNHEGHHPFYNLETDDKVARYIAYNLLRGATLSQIDGFAGRDDGEAVLTKQSWRRPPRRRGSGVD